MATDEVTLSISGEAWETMVGHAAASLPHECCGLLIGKALHVTLASPARNLRESPTRFLVHPEDHFAAIRDADERGLSVVGAYHSHPSTAPEPSPTDLKESADPELIHVIVSLAGGTDHPWLAACRIRSGRAEPLNIVREQ